MEGRQIGENGWGKLSWSQDFPWASCGNKGNLGLTNDMKLETGTSLACSVQTDNSYSTHK